MSSSTAFDLKLDAVTQRYKGAASAAVDAVSLDIAAGELVALLPGTPLDVPLYWHQARLASTGLRALSDAVARAAAAGLVAVP